MADSPAPRAATLWTGAVVILALLVGIPGALRQFRPAGGPPDPAAVRVPELLAPEGELEDPPRVFRWTPGGDDVDFSQVLIYRGSFERIWESSPLLEPFFEVDPHEAFRGIPAGEECAWKVREVVNGRPRAGSRVALFTFQRDHRGVEAGAANPESRYITE